MNERKNMINKLELFGNVTFWVSCIGGLIILFMGLKSCSETTSAMGEYGSYMGVSDSISAIFGYFILIDAILMLVGITISYIAKAIALQFKETIQGQDSIPPLQKTQDNTQQDELLKF